MTKATTSPFSGLDIGLFKSVFSFPASTFGKVSEMSKQNAEALASATTALAQGAHTLCAQSVALSKATAESNVAALKALAGAKSAQEAIEVQTAHVQASIARFVGEVSKISETYTSSVKSAAAPLRARVSAALKPAEPVA